MIQPPTITAGILGIILLLSSLGVVLIKKPVHAALSFLVSLLSLSAFYLQLHAELLAVIQILVYAGAILVIFMFVIILFQDAYQKLGQSPAKSSRALMITAVILFSASLIVLCNKIDFISSAPVELTNGFGSVSAIGKTLFIDFFFPFEAIVLLFLVAVVSAVYIGKRGEA